MKLPKLFRDNIVLKITSLNAVVISIRLVVSVFVQRFLAISLGESGIASIGQIRNVLGMLTSFSTLGTFNGVVKYVAELRQNKPELVKVFSTASIFLLIGSLVSAVILFFGAHQLSLFLFNSETFSYAFKLLAFVVPFLAINRMIGGIVNGVSDYKSYAKIELISYLIASFVLLVGLYTYNLKGVIVAIVLAPIIQLLVLVLVFGKVLKTIISFNLLKINVSYKNKLLSFTLMSFVSTFLLNYIELDIRTYIADDLGVDEAGYWTGITFISKNYMVFASGLFTLYVLPKFAGITNEVDFKKEVANIYKTILPIFGLGMLLVYVLRNIIIQIVYPDFTGMEPLFKWQLLGDFIRLGSLVLAHQFLAKRLVKSFIITELISMGLFLLLSKVFVQQYGTEGVVLAHFVRYVVYFVMVVVVIKMYFNNQKKEKVTYDEDL